METPPRLVSRPRPFTGPHPSSNHAPPLAGHAPPGDGAAGCARSRAAAVGGGARWPVAAHHGEQADHLHGGAAGQLPGLHLLQQERHPQAARAVLRAGPQPGPHGLQEEPHRPRAHEPHHPDAGAPGEPLQRADRGVLLGGRRGQPHLRRLRGHVLRALRVGAPRPQGQLRLQDLRLQHGQLHLQGGPGDDAGPAHQVGAGGGRGGAGVRQGHRGGRPGRRRQAGLLRLRGHDRQGTRLPQHLPRPDLRTRPRSGPNAHRRPPLLSAQL